MVRRFIILIAFFLVLGTVGLYSVVTRIERVRTAREQANLAASKALRPDIQIIVVEGKRREEIALILEQAHICSADEFLKASIGKEGELFPDTYRFFPYTPAAQVVSTLYSNYETRTAKANAVPTATQLSIASIVEREAIGDADRAAIAGVYLNRVRVGMRLEADPTVQYGRDTNQIAALGLSTNFTFWKDITQDDYHGVPSPYNTYLNDGLPPTPIANPGLASIQAAIHPTISNYFYFLYRNGKLLLSKTIEEHQSKQ